MKNFNNKTYLKYICKDCYPAILFCDDKNNKDLLYTAISSNYRVFACVSRELKSDFDFTLRCAQISPQIVKYVSTCLLTNDVWLLKSIKNNCECFLYLSKINPAITTNKQFCYFACENLANVDEFDRSIFQDYDFLLKLISKNCFAIEKILKYCEMDISKKENICLEALSICEQVFCVLPQEIKQNGNFIQRAIFANIKVKNYL